ncbi:MAG: C45 family peptidase [Desulfurococcales archaeon]|nr:C45 family peptidase [Desulfurococcales archaeon]
MPRRILALALVLVGIVALSSLPGASASQPPSAASAGEPRYIVRPTGFGFSLLLGAGRAGPLKVIYISGSPYDRGYEYGYLAAEEIAGVLNWAYNILGKAYGVPGRLFRQKLLSMAEKYEPYIPQEYLEEMKGIAAGFNAYTAAHPGVGLGYNITYKDILVINSFVDFSCTGAVISGNLTVDSMIISGTTIDAPPLAPYFVYVVERPTSGHQIAYYTAAGSLFQNGFNDAGLGMTEHGVHTWRVIGIPEMIRDRYVVQYASNVTQAIELLQKLFNKGFSGYGDALLLSDAQGNIAVVEVSPYRIRYLVNPREGPTWPPEDPFLVEPQGTSLLPPTNYMVVFKVGYDHVLQGKGWIVRQGIYALKDMIVGLPGYPKTWEEAINSKNYTWVWEDSRGYLMAHYIYDKVLSGEKISLRDMVEASKLPLIGDRPDDDGAIWMEPQIGLVAILKGQSSFAKPVFLQVFYPLPTPKPGHPSPAGAGALKALGAIYNKTLSLEEAAAQVKAALEALQSNTTRSAEAIQQLLAAISSHLDQDSTALQEAIKSLQGTCSQVLEGQKTVTQKLQEVENVVARGNHSINTRLDKLQDTAHKTLELGIATLVVALIILGITAALLARRPAP